MQIAILLYHRFTALDAVGPYEVLSLLPGAQVLFVAEQPGPVTDSCGSLQLVADAPLDGVPARTSCRCPVVPAPVTAPQPVVEGLREGYRSIVTN